MSTCLRSSGNLARLSRRSIESAGRTRLSSPVAGLRSPLVISPLSSRRSYANVPPQDPKPPKDKRPTKKSKDGADASPKSVNPGQKPSDPEQVNENESTSSKPPSADEHSAEARVNSSRLSKEDEEALKQIEAILSMGMGEAQRKDFAKAVQMMKEEGVSDEMRDVMEHFKSKQTFTIGDSMRVIRLINSLARKSGEVKSNDMFSSTKPQQKAGVHDPGPQDKKNQKQKKDEKGPGIFFKTNSGSGGSEDGKVFGIKWDTGTLITSAFVGYLTYRAIVPGENTREITWQEFKTQYLDRGLVEKLTVVNGKSVKVTLNRDAVRSVYPDSPAAHANFYYYFSIGDVGTFERHLDEAHDQLQIPSNQRIPVSFEEPTPWLGALLSFAPTLLLLGGTFWLLRRSAGGGSSGSNGIFGMGRSRAKKFNHETEVKTTFKDVAGMDEAKVEIMEFVSFLKEPGMYQKLGAKIPRGAILSGPPGTGKTLLAKATAGESGVPFFSVSGSEFVEMFVGVGASRVRDMFQTARKSAPAIIFIDEIDAIGKSRAKNSFGGGNDEREATLNQILTEMDGFNTSEQVVVLAGTNRADVLDKALMRPGRFDRHIAIDRPTMEGRRQIFAVHLKNIVTKEEPVHLRGRLAALTPGFAGADIANCVNEAALIAARKNADSVTMEHFEAAIERVVGGLEKKSLVLNPEEKKTVAYHEAGHAICGWFFKYADPLLKVSIIPRGQGALGYAQYLPAGGDTYLMNVNQLMDRMAMTLGGRVSEELHFDTVTSGASDDFNKVTRLATAMVTKFGMSQKVGYLYYEDDPAQNLHKPFSEETARNIDTEVKRIVSEAYTQCRELLVEKKKEVGLVAEELLSKEVLGREDLIRILGPRPFEDKSDFAKYFGAKEEREAAGAPSSTPESPIAGLSLGGGVGPAPTVFKGSRPSRRWA